MQLYRLFISIMPITTVFLLGMDEHSITRKPRRSGDLTKTLSVYDWQITDQYPLLLGAIKTGDTKKFAQLFDTTDISNYQATQLFHDSISESNLAISTLLINKYTIAITKKTIKETLKIPKSVDFLLVMAKSAHHEHTFWNAYTELLVERYSKLHAIEQQLLELQKQLNSLTM